MSRSLFAKIHTKKQSGGGDYIAPGRYRLRIKKISAPESRKDEGQTNFIAEFEVLECEGSKGAEAPFKAGDDVTWLVKMSWKSALDNINGFFCAVANCEPHEVTETACEEAVSDDNPCAGIVVNALAYNVKTRDGGDFTKVNWSTDGAEPAAA